MSPKLSRGFTKPKKDVRPSNKMKAVEAEILHEEINHEQIVSELRKEGIHEFTNEDISEDYLQLPMFLTELESSELGNYFNTFTKQRMWVRTVRGRLKSYVNDIEYELDRIRLAVYSTLPAKLPNKEKEVAILANERAQELVSRLKHYQSKLFIVDAYLDNLEDAIHNISREITRRQKDFDYETTKRGRN
jgi:tRNA(Ser,Leu) C12 N-acetylase TAN1